VTDEANVEGVVGPPPIVRKIHYFGVGVAVRPKEGGGKEFAFLDPATATEHVIPLSEEHAHGLGAALSVGGLQVADAEDVARLTKE
jgi:hypothetical protein